MKPGCFLKSIIILTIIVAAIAYIIQYKSELFINSGKKMLKEAFVDDWDKEFDYVRNTSEKDKLKDSLKVFLDSLKLDNLPNEKYIDRISRMVKNATADSVISDSELELISKNLKLLKK